MHGIVHTTEVVVMYEPRLPALLGYQSYGYYSDVRKVVDNLKGANFCVTAIYLRCKLSAEKGGVLVC